jgi:REP element-mobilizing transposase RayT
LPDTYYHIYQRGNNRQNIFLEAENYRYFLKLYTKYIVPIAETFAYCLLPNHMHFLIRTRNQQTYDFSEKSYVYKPPSEQFRRLYIAYTKAINKRYQRTGSLFENRFGRKLVTNDRYFCTLIRYIHQNPVRHGIVDNLSDWPYSSYDAILHDKQTRVAKTAVFDWFGSPAQFQDAHQTEVDEHLLEQLIESGLLNP